MPAPAAAATSKQRIQQQKSIVRARDACRRKAEKRNATASKVFDSLANSEGRLDEHQVETFLETALLIHKDKLDAEAVRLVTDTAIRSRRSSAVNHDHHHDDDDGETINNNSITTASTSFSKPAMMHAIQKYGLYLRKRDEINTIFEKFDIDKDGYLSRMELKQALQERERTANRAVNGIHIELFVAEDDLDFILKEADSEGDGMIDKAEVLPALAAWEDLALEELVELENAGVCSCIIL
jgi:Ca2+-binding EF-hand superfamily protein